MEKRPGQSCVFCLNLSQIKSETEASRDLDDREITGINESGDSAGQNNFLKNEVRVIFIVRKLLSLPLNECELLLKLFGNPSKWLNTCKYCSEVVNEAKKVYQKICVLEKELDGLRNRVKEKIFTSNSKAGDRLRCKLAVVATPSEPTVRIRCSFLQINEFTTSILEDKDSALKEELPENEVPTECSDNEDAFTSDSIPIHTGSWLDDEDNRIKRESKRCRKRKVGCFKRKGNGKKLKVPSLSHTTYNNYTFCPTEYEEQIDQQEHLRKVHDRRNSTRYGLNSCHPKRLECRHCRTQLPSLEKFKEHCVNEHGLLSCTKCPRLLMSQRTLRAHYKQIHKSKLPSKRNKILKTIPATANDKPAPVKTSVVGGVEIYQCLYCNYCSKRKGDVRRHMGIMHWTLNQQLLKSTVNSSNDDDDFASSVSLRCDKCPPPEEDDDGINLFSSMDELNNHKVTAHGMVKCKECEGVFLGFGYLENHQLLYHSTDKADPSAWTYKQNLSNTSALNKNRNATKVYRCKFCQETFETSAKLTQHNLDEHSSEMFKCDKCSKLFDKVSSLYHHKTEIHKEPDNPYKCFQCDYTNRHYREVYRHQMLVHQKRSRVVCELCSSTFATEKYLKCHKAQKHGTGDLNSHCKQCNKTFSTPDYLSTHIATVHLGQWRYKCPYCENGFRCKMQVESHVNAVHKNVLPYECTVEGCIKKFSTPSKLKYHVASAHGPKVFKCSYCNYAAGKKSIIAGHEKKHTDIGPHICDHCGKVYNQYKSLLQHLRLAHKIRKARGIKAKLTSFIASVTAEENNM